MNSWLKKEEFKGTTTPESGKKHKIIIDYKIKNVFNRATNLGAQLMHNIPVLSLRILDILIT